MSGDTWYYAAGQDQRGPLTTDQLSALVRSGTVSGDTYVWMPALPDWMPLSQTELAPLLARPSAASPPPVFRSPDSRQPVMGGAPADFITAVKTCVSKFVTWQGRAGRTEFWYFVLFCVASLVVATIIDSTLSLRAGGAGLLATVVDLVILLPNLAVAVRRLHDTDRSAWWLLLSFVPLVGFIALIWFYAQKGTEGDNRYGPPVTT
jgi:uncharacterized membrane protein YhaH (DUF805 family)